MARMKNNCFKNNMHVSLIESVVTTFGTVNATRYIPVFLTKEMVTGFFSYNLCLGFTI